MPALEFSTPDGHVMTAERIGHDDPPPPSNNANPPPAMKIGDDSALESVSDLLVTMGFVVLNILELALSLIPLFLLSLLIVYLLPKKNQIQATQKQIFTCVFAPIVTIHCLWTTTWFMFGSGEGEQRTAWWLLLLTSVLGFWAVAIGVGFATALLVGLMRGWAWFSGKGKEEGEGYKAVETADEHELEEAEAPPEYEESDKAAAKPPSRFTNVF